MASSDTASLPGEAAQALVRREPAIPNGTLGMLIFVTAEAMLFAGLISAHTIAESNSVAGWPPIDQPRLPVGETAFNTAALLLSGLMLFLAKRSHDRDPAKGARPMLAAILLGAFFVLFQGGEWVALVGEGLTLTLSNYSAFFYLIVGTHAVHAISALMVLVYAFVQLRRGLMTPGLFGATAVLWYFVVAVWPFLYAQVYL